MDTNQITRKITLFAIHCYPAWMSKDIEERLDQVELLFFIADEIGMKPSEAIQSLILKNGFICVKAKSAKMLSEARGVAWDITKSGSVKQMNLVYEIRTVYNGKEYASSYSINDLVNSGRFNPEEEVNPLSSISQRYPDRTCLAKAISYHYADFHKVSGIEVFEEIESYSEGSSESATVKSASGMDIKVGDHAKRSQQVKNIVEEGRSITGQEEDNPLVPKASAQIDLEDSIKEIESSSPSLLSLGQEVEVEGEMVVLSEKGMAGKNLAEMIDIADAIDVKIQRDITTSFSRKKTGKLYREAIIAYLSGSFDKWIENEGDGYGDNAASKGEAPAEEEKEREYKEDDKEFPNPFDNAPPAQEEAPSFGEDSRPAEPEPQGWFWTVEADKRFKAPLSEKEMHDAHSEFLGLSIMGTEEEAERLVQKLLDKRGVATKMPAKVEPKKLAYGPETLKIGESVSELPQSKKRSSVEIMTAWMAITKNNQLVTKLSEKLLKNGKDVEEFLETTSRGVILDHIEECING